MHCGQWSHRRCVSRGCTCKKESGCTTDLERQVQMGGRLAGSCEAPREVMRPGLRQGDGVEGMALRELKGWITWGPMERA